jgi:hypothetical protein
MGDRQHGANQLHAYSLGHMFSVFEIWGTAVVPQPWQLTLNVIGIQLLNLRGVTRW